MKGKAKGDAHLNADLDAARTHLQYTLAQRPHMTEACRMRHRLSSIAAGLGFPSVLLHQNESNQFGESMEGDSKLGQIN